jgi:hypothetical protein
MRIIIAFLRVFVTDLRRLSQLVTPSVTATAQEIRGFERFCDVVTTF